jgi:ribose transport system substrate-binding protein
MTFWEEDELMAKNYLSNEERLALAATRIRNPISRRVFIQLAAAAGVSLPLNWRASAAVVSGKIAAQYATLANDYWASWVRGFEATTKSLGLDSQQITHNNDAAREIAQVRGLPASGVKMLVNVAATAGEVPAMVRLSQENKIYNVVIWEIPTWFTPPDVGDYFVSYMTPHSAQAGYEVAKELFKSINGEGTVVHIKGLASPTDEARTAGLTRAAMEEPGIKIVGGLRSDWTREGARKIMLSMVTAYPDMKGVFAQNDSMALGALSVLKERGLEHVNVCGIDGLSEGLEEVAKGGQFVATQTSLPPYQAGFATVAVFDALNGWKPKVPERMLYTGSTLATPENAADINKRIYHSTELPFDWKKMSRTLNPDNWDPQNVILSIDPDVHWAGQEGKDKLNTAYATARDAGEFEAVNKLYADHYKSGPFR